MLLHFMPEWIVEFGNFVIDCNSGYGAYPTAFNGFSVRLFSLLELHRCP